MFLMSGVFFVLCELSESVRVLVLRLNVAVATFPTTCHLDLTTLRALRKWKINAHLFFPQALSLN